MARLLRRCVSASDSSGDMIVEERPEPEGELMLEGARMSRRRNFLIVEFGYYRLSARYEPIP